jgi:hypothetical protein
MKRKAKFGYKPSAGSYMAFRQLQVIGQVLWYLDQKIPRILKSPLKPEQGVDPFTKLS